MGWQWAPGAPCPYRVVAVKASPEGPRHVFESWVEDGRTRPEGAAQQRVAWEWLLAHWETAPALSAVEWWVWRLPAGGGHWPRSWIELAPWATLAYPQGIEAARVALALDDGAEEAEGKAEAVLRAVAQVAERLGGLAPRTRQDLVFLVGAPRALANALTAASDDGSEPSPLDRPAPEERRGSGPLPAVSEPLALEDFWGPGGRLARALEGYAPRAGQEEMATRVATALDQGQWLLVEAPTGVGKSLGYLVPAVLTALRHGKRVVVATHTVALQHQLWARDLPAVQGDLPVRTALVKGRGRYLCLLKLDRLRQAARPLAEPAPVRWALARVLSYVAQDPTGERDGLGEGDEALLSVLDAVGADRDACRGPRCPYAGPCFLRRAREAAERAHLLVVNHALLAAHAAEGTVLPDFSWAVVDEAHRFAEAAEAAFGFRLDLRAWSRAWRLDDHRFWRALSGRAPLGAGVSRFGETLAALAAQLAALAERLQETGKESLAGDETGQAVRVTPAVRQRWAEDGTAAQLATVREVGRQAVRQGLDLWAAAEAAWGPEADQDPAWLTLAGWVGDLGRRLADLEVWGGEEVEWVDWWEVVGGPPPRVYLCRAPLAVGQRLRERLWDRVAGGVLTSATLGAGGTVGSVAERLGIPSARTAWLVLPSPFDLARQARLAVVTDLGDVDAPEFLGNVADFVARAAAVAGGRTLVLLTAHRAVRTLAAALRPQLNRLGIALWAQGVDGSGARLASRFRSHPRAVLVGAATFWEGVDLPGGGLRLVVIGRLPFRVPHHPLEAAHHEALLAAGRKPFAERALPEAIARFRQGFGRLIRGPDDLGVVAVLDRRMVLRAYGERFRQAVGEVPLWVGDSEAMLARLQAFLADAAGAGRTNGLGAGPPMAGSGGASRNPGEGDAASGSC